MIYDTDGNGLLSANFAIRSGEVVTGSFQVDCASGWQISGEAVADVTVELKHSAAGGYTNIETTPIALGTWDGTVQTFNFRMTAGTITSATTRAFKFTVARA
jgi:hypothetical protein